MKILINRTFITIKIVFFLSFFEKNQFEKQAEHFQEAN